MPNTVRRALRGVGWGVLCIGLASCGESGAEDPLAATTIPLPPVIIDRGTEEPFQLIVPTYEGSGQVIHPDVAFIPGGWLGWEYWMAVTPYPYANEYWENASVFVSHDGLDWGTLPGATNPVVAPPHGDVYHNSDPDLVVLPKAGKMLLFDRAVTANKNQLVVTRSTDGVHWSDPRTVLETPRHEMVSPAVVVVPGRRPRLWYVNAGSAGCDARNTTVRLRRWPSASFSAETLGGPGWGTEAMTNLQAPPGWVLWHLDVIWVSERKEYWALFPAHRPGEPCLNSDLFVARSRDGVTWDVLPDPLIRRGAAWFADRSIYRSTMVYDAEHAAFRVWFSSNSGDFSWRMGYKVFPTANLVALLDRR